MIYQINETHDPNLRSWVASANKPEGDFPIQNLPFGIFKRLGGDSPPAVGIAIGDQVLDIPGCVKKGLFDGLAAQAAERCLRSSLNGLMSLEWQYWSALRKRVSKLLTQNDTKHQSTVENQLVPMTQIEMQLPVEIGDFTDFYASVYHATNVGSMFRPDAPLLPNYKYVPVGYHGRSSSVIVSGTPIRRPHGQMQDHPGDKPHFAPSRLLDYELEVGFFVGPGNPLGKPINIGEAREHIVGLCIVNDWSARDIQKWEYQPLGPFLAKSFGTTISPWVVTAEALEPFRVPVLPRPKSDPEPLAYLDSLDDRNRGGIDIILEVFISSRRMRDQGLSPVRLSRGNFKDMYWTIAQMLVHHTSNGCNLRPGDLIASGTVSGATRESRGCLLELTWRGDDPIRLPSGETRTFLEDGDEVTMRGYCERDGFVRIGYGECRGAVLAAAN